MIRPGQSIGMLGGGQLGRMTGQAARSLGYGFVVYEPSAHCPAGHVADLEINAPYSDPESIDDFIDAVDVVSFEFENVDAFALDRIGQSRPIHPSPNALRICQHREREKHFLKKRGFPHSPFMTVTGPDELARAVQEIGTPSVLKTATFGYDGKGQQKISDRQADWAQIWRKFGGNRAVLEGWMDFAQEISVMVANGANGQSAAFPVAENIHTNHILDYSIVPARIEPSLAAQAETLARDVASALKIVGLLGVEMFVMRDGSLIINEMAPRPHNSGHYTIDACVTSQFEQFVRAFCGLPLGSTRLLSPVAMVNILGDAWQEGPPAFEKILRHPEAKLHLYGKADSRVGRKMGHFCVLDESADAAYQTAKQLKLSLSPTHAAK